MPEPADTPASTPPASEMPAQFGLATATFVIVASMVGAGVLTTSGYTVFVVGSNQLMLGMWVLGGLIALCGALSLCELSAALPKTGGDYVYLREAYGPLIAFLSGWVSFLIGFAAPSALAAFGSAKYLLAPLNLDPTIAAPAQRVLATALIFFFAAVHLTSRSRTASIQVWITTLKLVLLAIFVVAGLAFGSTHLANFDDRPPITWDLVQSMTFSLVFISYAYIGWNAASFLAEEIVEPQRRLPRAILLGTVGVVTLYIGLNLVYGLALSVQDVRAIVASPDNKLPGHENVDAVAEIAQIAASRLFGQRWSAPFSVAVGLMLLSSLSAYVLSGPRVVYAMAKAGQFPSVAGRLTKGAKTPAVATALQVAVTLIQLWTGSFQSILIYTSVGLAIFSMLNISAVYVLRWKRPDLPRPFRTPGYPFTPAGYLIPTAVLTLAAFSSAFQVASFSLLSILAGIPLYYLCIRTRPPAFEPPAA